MASEMEFVNYKDFVKNLAETESLTSSDKVVISNPTNGPRSIPGSAKDRSTAITAFRAGDVIPVDGPNGPAKMGKDDLLNETAQNALADNVAPAFVPDSTTTVAGQAYIYDGSVYIAKKSGYQGPWDASKFKAVSLAELLESNSESIERLYSDGIKETRTLVAVGNNSWTVYDMPFHKGVTYSISIAGVSSNAYIEFMDANDSVIVNLTLTADQTITRYMNADVIKLRIYTSSTLTITSGGNEHSVLRDCVNSVNAARLDIATDSRTIGNSVLNAWETIPYKLYAGVLYSISITGVSGTAYVQLLDANDGVVRNYTVTADSVNTLRPSVNITKIKFFAGTKISVSSVGDEYGVVQDNKAQLDIVEKNNQVVAQSIKTKTLNAWVNYDYRLFAGVEYKVSVTGVSGTAYVVFRDKNQQNLVSYTLTADSTEIFKPRKDVYSVRVFAGTYITITTEGNFNLFGYSEKVMASDYYVKDKTANWIYVSQDGTKDFTTIGDALASITDSSVGNQYEVIVYPGIYNEVNLILPDYVHVHALQPNSVVVTSEGLGGTEPVFDAKGTGAKLSELSIISDTGYCIHVDNSAVNVAVFTGLYCKKTSFAAIIGIGTHGGGSIIEFNGCTFENGYIGAHTSAGTLANNNCKLRIVNCKFNRSTNLRLGLAAGVGTNICEIVGCIGCRGEDSFGFWTNDYRSASELDTYFALPCNWKVIGSGNQNFTFNRDVANRHGLKVEAVNYGENVSISGTAVSVLFGVTKVKAASSIIKGAVYGSLRVDDVQNGNGSADNPYVDRVEMWNRLGDCSITNKTLSVTTGETTQTYTFDQDYTLAKPSEATILSAINAVITASVVSAYSPDFADCVDTTEKVGVKIGQNEGVVKGTFVDAYGNKCAANSKSYDVFGVALEDGVKNEVIPVWTGDMAFASGIYSDGEYGIGSDGKLDLAAAEKIGFVLNNKFYRF